MSKKSKGLASQFNNVAVTDNIKEKNNTNTNVSTNYDFIEETNNSVDTNVNEENTINITTDNETNTSIDDIINSVTSKAKTVKKRQISVYIDEDIAIKLDKFAKKNGGKGVKSDLINNFLKSVFNK